MASEGATSNHEERCSLPPHATLARLPEAEQKMEEQYDVAIIGAGVAGLAAAWELLKKGRKEGKEVKLVVVEARERLGGRVNTRALGGEGALDVGASFIHGQQSNPVAELLKSHGVMTRHVNWEEGRFCGSASHGANAVRVETHADDKYFPITEMLDGAKRKWGKSRSGRGKRRGGGSSRGAVDEEPADISVRELIDGYLLPAQAQDGAARFGLEWQLHECLEADWAADPRDMSARRWGEDQQLGGGDCLVEGGYGQLIELLQQGVQVRLGCQVHAIVRGNPAEAKGVVIELASGLSLRAHRAIVTLPAGVLKANAVEFHPPLPDGFSEALGLLGVSNLVWAHLLLESPWWPPALSRQSLVFNLHASSATTWPYILRRDDIPAAAGVPFVISLGAGGPEAHRIDGLSDAELLQELRLVLEQLTGIQPPESVALVRSRWAVDPLARGCYSYLRVGFQPRHHRILCQSIDDQIFWAGEHTSNTFRATVHGAFISGLRVAREVFSQLIS